MCSFAKDIRDAFRARATALNASLHRYQSCQRLTAQRNLQEQSSKTEMGPAARNHVQQHFSLQAFGDRPEEHLDHLSRK